MLESIGDGFILDWDYLLFKFEGVSAYSWMGGVCSNPCELWRNFLVMFIAWFLCSYHSCSWVCFNCRTGSLRVSSGLVGDAFLNG